MLDTTIGELFRRTVRYYAGRVPHLPLDARADAMLTCVLQAAERAGGGGTVPHPRIVRIAFARLNGASRRSPSPANGSPRCAAVASVDRETASWE